MTRRRVGCLLAGLLAAGCVAAGQQATPITADQRSQLERLTLARARSELLRLVSGLPLRDELNVGQWMAAHGDRDRTLRLWIRARPWFAPPRIYSDGSAEVDIRLEPQELARRLTELAESYPGPADTPLKPADIQRAAADWPVLWATGEASLGERTSPAKPRGWEDVTQDGIELARRAAAADAVHALLDQAGRLKLTNARQLRDFIEADAEIRRAALEAVERAARVQVDLALDQVAIATATIQITDLIRELTRVHQQHYRGQEFTAADFREMALLVRADRLEASGLAVPPESTRTVRRYRDIDLDAPAWVDSRLTATGQVTPQPGDDPTLAAESARLAAIETLRDQLLALPLREGVTVEQFLAYHGSLKQDVLLLLTAARPASQQTLPDGSLDLQVELPLRRLWQILTRGMDRIEIEPHELPTTSQPAATRPAGDTTP